MGPSTGAIATLIPVRDDLKTRADSNDEEDLEALADDTSTHDVGGEVEGPKGGMV